MTDKFIQLTAFEPDGLQVEESFYTIDFDSEEEYQESKDIVAADYREQGLRVVLTEISDRRFAIERFMIAMDFPEWQDYECSHHLPERMSEN